jgi:protein-S-isoprenylcysteine O-methyltransferase Ste14
MSLKSRLIAQTSASFAAMLILVFLPAGTLNFWEAWVFVAILFIPMVIFSIYFLIHDPAVVQRRMQQREKIKAQKWIMGVATVVSLAGMVVPGLDHRFGWSRQLAGGVPLWLKICAQVIMLAAYLTTMWVIYVNRFASRTIQVEAGQKVISSGPYRWVRHPMYSAAMVMWLFSPIALGSYVAVPFFALIIPTLVFRLLNEEKMLRQELPGYDAYCRKTRYRLIPFAW